MLYRASYPVETIKTRMQMGGGTASLKGGFLAMYAGLGGSLVGQIPYGMLTFGTYEMYKAAMLKNLPVRASIYLSSENHSDGEWRVIRRPR